MKKMKRLLSVLLTLVMVLAMAAPGFADEEKGSIKITNATKEKVYSAYKLFDANPSGTKDSDGKDLIAYKATSSVKTWFEKQEGNPFTFTQVGDLDVYNVGRQAGISDADVTQFLQGLVVDEKGELDETKSFFTQFRAEATETAQTNEVVLTVPYGYYMVTSSLGATVSVDYTNKNAEILDKNQSGPSWDDDPDDPENDHGKKIVVTDDKSVPSYETESSANYGEKVDFQIKFTTTNYHGAKEIDAYYVYDKLAAGMEYDQSSLKVKVGDSEIETSEYETTWSDDNGFTIKVPWSTENPSPSTITVNYKATVKDTAVIAGEGNKNTAWFTFTEKPEGGQPGGPEIEIVDKERETTTYTFALGINKTDESGNGLGGAEFTLPDGLKVKATGEDGVYTYTEDTDGSNTVTSSATESTKGQIIIKGVKAGSYTLTETKAPEGYNLLDGPVTIQAAIEKATRETYKTTYFLTYEENADGDIVVTKVEEGTTDAVKVEYAVNVVLENVVNRAGATLPSTGGIGTTIFYAAGIILMAGAVFFVVRRRRA